MKATPAALESRQSSRPTGSARPDRATQYLDLHGAVTNLMGLTEYLNQHLNAHPDEPFLRSDLQVAENSGFPN
jgi:hypothetical protein